MISRLHYITPNKRNPISSLQNIIEGGVEWIQLRLKDIDDEPFIATAKEVKTLCDKNNVQLIINDRVEVALAIDASGVHLGQQDMAPSEARKILGGNKVIGGTANTFEDVIRLVREGVDYIGLGPFQFTSTKKTLSPILGIEGYKDIINQCRFAGIKTPIIAIGGIGVSDVPSLLDTGLHGIAISAAIQTKEDVASFKMALRLNDKRIVA